jgi:hypothetical protein
MPCLLLSVMCLALWAPRSDARPAARQAAPVASAPQPIPHAPAPPADTTPLNLTDERLQTYIVFRHELHAASWSYIQEMAKAGKNADPSPSDPGRQATAMKDMSVATTRRKADLEALRSKYGFSATEDSRIWQAISAVAMASPDNPMLANTAKMFADMQKKDETSKKAADAYFAGLAADQQKRMGEAKEKFGPQAVAVLARHTQELYDLQMDALHAGRAPSPAAPR